MKPITVVANRLPVRWDQDDDQWVTSPGGLVSALSPVFEERGGAWVGWTGVADQDTADFEVEGIRQHPVSLTTADVRDYYLGFCNGTIWPLYHDAMRPPEFHRHWWRPYREVNRRFADRTAEVAGDTAVWVHDYQLQLVPGLLREAGFSGRIGFFLHIPFPPPEIFARLPWRAQILRGLLGSDVIGFQTRRAMRNFAAAARMLVGARGPADELQFEGRAVRLEASPISIDFELYEEIADRPEVIARATALREELGNPKAILLGVDRLDYTKGIDIRLRALDTLFERRPELAGELVFVQVAVPSREQVGEYRLIREEIERLVGRINGTHGRGVRTPVRYMYRSLDQDELVAYYRAADVMVITPLRDGMNLVAKEYLAARTEGTGALILSEFAGAAEQLNRAVLVNPYDIDAVAEAYETAVSMRPDEERRRLAGMRRSVRRWDVHAWAAHMLRELTR